MTRLHDLTALEQAAAVRAGEVSPSELVEHSLGRIDALDAALGAFLTVTPEHARAAARRAEALLRTGGELPPLLGVPILLGAGLWGLASALAINAVARSRRIGADAAIGVVTTASFALGVALLTRFGGSGPSFDALLFGSINGVSSADLLLLTGALAFAVLVFTVGYRSFLFSSFDPEVADVSGVSVRRTEAMLMVVLSLSILATLQIIGVTLVAATLVIPAVVARMACESFGRMLRISTSLGAAAGAVGMYLSYQLEIPSGTTIVLVNALAFLVVLGVTGGRALRRTAGLDDHAAAPAALVAAGR